MSLCRDAITERVHANFAVKAHSVASRSLRQHGLKVSETHKRAAAASKSVAAMNRATAANDGQCPCSAAAVCATTAGAASSPPA